MVFSSILFLYQFLPGVLLLYYLLTRRSRNGFLLLASLFFYSWGEPRYILIMVISTVLDYSCGRGIHFAREKGKEGAAKGWLLLSLFGNLGMLGFFKYSGFLAQNLSALTGWENTLPAVALPIGISFYTFQTLSYTIDVYRKETKMQPSIISFGAYVTLFPQLIAGPIVRYATVAWEMDHRRENWKDFSAGITRFFLGLGKKVLLANNIGLLWKAVSAQNPETLPGVTAWLGILAFGFQIYFDFSGYSDMAIGMGQMLGFHFLENFNYPYMALSITEFWRRWHISLGTWFREYVYIPLGGNRGSRFRQMRNILLVWALTGIWHGASWNFLLWGLYFGLILMGEKLFLLRWLETWPKFWRRVYTLTLVAFSWVIFAFEEVAQGAAYVQALLGKGGFADGTSLYLLQSYGLLLVLLAVGSTDLPAKLFQRMPKNTRTREALASGLLLLVLGLSTAYLVDQSYNPFLYFRF